MYFTSPPSFWRVVWTVGVRATGEKTAREPEDIFTVAIVSRIHGAEEEEYPIPMVARPPTLISPNRRNGTESVVMPGTTSRITMTASGFAGTSLDDIFVIVF
jgi:hypothetical protein